MKHADIITNPEKMQLWKSGVIGTRSPSALLNAVFFMNGKVLRLHGGRKHRMLKLSQFSLGSDESSYFVLYQENGSKYCLGSYKEKGDANKIIKHYANVSLGSMCYVHVMKCYFSKIDTEVLQELSVFYYRAMQQVGGEKTNKLLVGTH